MKADPRTNAQPERVAREAPWKPVWDAREQMARCRGERWQAAKNVIVPAVRRAWCGFPEYERDLRNAVGAAHQVVHAYWLEEPYPLSIRALRELIVESRLGLPTPDEEALFDHQGMLMSDGWLKRLPWLKPHSSAPNWWTWRDIREGGTKTPRS